MNRIEMTFGLPVVGGLIGGAWAAWHLSWWVLLPALFIGIVCGLALIPLALLGKGNSDQSRWRSLLQGIGTAALLLNPFLALAAAFFMVRSIW